MAILASLLFGVLLGYVAWGEADYGVYNPVSLYSSRFRVLALDDGLFI